MSRFVDVDDLDSLRRSRRMRRERPVREEELGVELPRVWSRHTALGPNLRIQARAGFRAAIVEVKPGLFVVAEVPQKSVEIGFGPLVLAPALVKTVGRVMQQREQRSRQVGAAQRPLLPAPEAKPRERKRLTRWLDDDVAAEIGCPCEEDFA